MKKIKKMKLNSFKKMFKNLFFISIFTIIFASCKGEKCEGFNFKRLPMGLKYYNNPLVYTNGLDTVSTYSNDFFFSKESHLSALSNPECNPRIELSFDTKPYSFNLHYSLKYIPSSPSTELIVGINMTQSDPIKLNSYSLPKFKSNEMIKLNREFKEPEYGVDSSRTFKYLTLQKMRVIEFEFLDGTKWRLIK